jgi:predicted ATPase/DNA-binding SARP family transcriptional activator
MTMPDIALTPDLPVPLTKFVGRERELDDVTRLLRATRLLTLTGAGGSGKTRLAREVVARGETCFARVWWVDLAPMCDTASVAERVASTLRVPDRAERAALDAVVDAIAGTDALLVLDNCEHLVEASADFAATMLQRCPQLTILATSREALGVSGETAWLVPALTCSEAEQLFTDRAQATLPSFALTESVTPSVHEICARLDGIPLAIELAAARVRVLTPEQIARRLDDVFRLLNTGSRTAVPRHRTLRATMEWSHALLAPREQTLLRRLSVFAGTFSLEAAEAVCAGDELEPDDILDGIAALVDKSLLLLIAGDHTARYRLLETVRQYASERLELAGERDDRERRHAEYYLALTGSCGLHVYEGFGDTAFLTALTADDDNLRAAMAWALRPHVPADIALRFADHLFWYWYASAMAFPGGQYRAARRFVEAALERADACADTLPEHRATALSSLGLIGLSSGDWPLAERMFVQSRAIAEAQNNWAHLAFASSKLGATRLMQGRVDEARVLLEQANALVTPQPPMMLQSFVWFWYGWFAMAVGDIATAREIALRHEALGRILGHAGVNGHANTLSGDLDLLEGKRDDAHRHYSTALRFHLDPQDAWGLMLDFEGFACLFAARRRFADAARLLGGGDALRERATIAVPSTAWARRKKLLEELRERIGGATVDQLLAEGRTLRVEELADLVGQESANFTAEFAVPAGVAPTTATGDVVAAPGAAACALPSTLRVLALGPLQVFVDGEAIPASAWGSARPRELLVYLLMHPEGRTKEQVGLALWPDATTTQLRNNFHVTMHRLRKALGRADWIDLQGERYRVLPSALAEFDALAFDREVCDAMRAVQRGQPGALAQLEQALEHFRGDFLDGEPAGDWHVQHRDRFQRLYVDGLMLLGDTLAQDARHARAADAYRRVLARDDLHEGALQALLRCQAAMGERSQIVRTYRTFADRMQRELESAPDEDTVALYESLVRGEPV